VKAFYHRTIRQNVRAIHGGFRDRRGTYCTSAILEGVWLSEVPHDFHKGAFGGRVLRLRDASGRAAPTRGG
jgi:hypothetical protein